MSYYPRESDPNLNYTEYPEETSSRSTHNSEVYPSNAGYTTINAGRSDDYGTSHYQSTVGNNSGYTDYGTSSYGDTSSTAFRNQTTSIAQGCTCQKNCASGIGCRCDEPYEASSDYGYGYDAKSEYGKLDPAPGTPQKACTCKGNCSPGTGCRQESGRRVLVDHTTSTKPKGRKHKKHSSKTK